MFGLGRNNIMNKFKKFGHEIDHYSKAIENDVKKFSLKDDEIKIFLTLKRASKNLLGKEDNDFLKVAWEQKDILKIHRRIVKK